MFGKSRDSNEVLNYVDMTPMAFAKKQIQDDFKAAAAGKKPRKRGKKSDMMILAPPKKEMAKMLAPDGGLGMGWKALREAN